MLLFCVVSCSRFVRSAGNNSSHDGYAADYCKWVRLPLLFPAVAPMSRCCHSLSCHRFFLQRCHGSAETTDFCPCPMCVPGNPARESRRSYCGEGRLFAQADVVAVSPGSGLCCKFVETCVFVSSLPTCVAISPHLNAAFGFLCKPAAWSCALLSSSLMLLCGFMFAFGSSPFASTWLDLMRTRQHCAVMWRGRLVPLLGWSMTGYVCTVVCLFRSCPCKPPPMCCC